MKCSHRGDFIIIILLIIFIANDKLQAFALVLNERSFDKNSVGLRVFSSPKNTLQDLDLFPNTDNPDTKHRIVKKQMGVSDERDYLKKHKKPYVETEKDKDLNVVYGLNSWTVEDLKKRFNKRESVTPKDNPERFISLPKDINAGEEEKQTKLKGIDWDKFRLKRDLFMRKKVEIPDPGPDPDNEPSNEWTDASQDNNQKIPAEFKPKPKQTLRIIHLSCKRDLKNQNLESAVGKRHTWNRFRCLDAGRRSFHPAKVYPTRVHPRSFLVRIKKKGDKNNQQEGKKKEGEKQDKDDDDDDEECEDEDEEEDQDEEDGEEETEYEDDEDNNASITPKPGRKETIKEFFKTAKEAVINRAKFNDGFLSGSLRSEGGKVDISLGKNDKDDESFSEKSKRVLIDANIKLDGTIGNALRGLLGHRKEKIVENKEGNEKLVNESELEENKNIKAASDGSQLTGFHEFQPENYRRHKRHLLSLLRKKNRYDESCEKGGLVSVDCLINGVNSEFDREELLQKLQNIKYKESKSNIHNLSIK